MDAIAKFVYRNKDQTTCPHSKLKEKRWVDKGGTRCMIMRFCPDCGLNEWGHVVNADPKTWTTQGDVGQRPPA